ncbi:MAG TPA: hypothetical protein VGH33_09055 [Isosphaeraceae bacterium]|jgi:hypothetical protein
MPFPRVRFTVRRMMVAVAILAAILAAFEAGVDGSATIDRADFSGFRP